MGPESSACDRRGTTKISQDSGQRLNSSMILSVTESEGPKQAKRRTALRYCLDEQDLVGQPASLRHLSTAPALGPHDSHELLPSVDVDHADHPAPPSCMGPLCQSIASRRFSSTVAPIATLSSSQAASHRSVGCITAPGYVKSCPEGVDCPSTEFQDQSIEWDSRALNFFRGLHDVSDNGNSCSIQ